MEYDEIYDIEQNIQWLEVGNTRYLYFRFSGKFKSSDAKSYVKRWDELITERTEAKPIVIWDCLGMSDYDADARILWQQKMKEMKNRVQHVWLVSDSRLVKSGAALLSMFTGYTIKTVKSITEIKD